MKPMAIILMTISHVKTSVNPSSSAGANSSGIGESGLPGGPWTASTAELAMMAVRVIWSNHHCSTIQMKAIRSRWCGLR